MTMAEPAMEAWRRTPGTGHSVFKVQEPEIMQMGSENYKEYGMAAANGVGAEGNEAREKEHHAVKAFGDAPRSVSCVLQARCILERSLLPASGGRKGNE